ncbi:hypothetical protein TorRG33x02_189150 [Trema orientale]|uniref:Uncharacterized protein n=1 Tax=Trema orientale TaxID=63057 RepID=A0A2P5EI80_TREOI|nr:hypothetical protein TorRG33x02_189150 [Trema orientale]
MDDLFGSDVERINPLFSYQTREGFKTQKAKAKFIIAGSWEFRRTAYTKSYVSSRPHPFPTSPSPSTCQGQHDHPKRHVAKIRYWTSKVSSSYPTWDPATKCEHVSLFPSGHVYKVTPLVPYLG